MTRILHVTECASGGVPRAIESISRVSSDNEHHILWPAANQTNPPTRFASVSVLPEGHMRRVKAVKEAVRRIMPDVVHAHSSFGGFYARAQRLPVPVVYQPHCYKFEDTSASKFASALYWIAERVLASRSDAVVVLSPRESTLARGLNPRAPRFFVPNVPTVPMDTRPMRADQPLSEVAMIGRLSPQKDPGYFIRVADLVKATRPDVKFTWIGGGTEAQLVRMRASGVRVTGWLGDSDLLLELQRPWVYLHSARYEGFPLSVLDAAAYGHPIVARRISAFEGTELLQAGEAAEAANLVLKVLGGEKEQRTAIDGANRLLTSMNSERQSESLDSLYAGYSTIGAPQWRS